MTALGWYFLTFVNVIFSFTFLFKRYGKFWLVTIPAIFMFSFVVFNVLGANYLISEYNLANIKYIVALNLSVIIHTVMFTVVDSIFKFNFKQEFNSFINEPICKDGYRFEFKFVFFIVTIIIFGITIIYLFKLQSIPVIDLIKNPSAQQLLAKSRELATTTFEGKYHRYTFFFKMLLPLFSLIAFSAGYYKKDKWWNVMFVILLTSTIFMQISDLRKAPLLLYLISILFLYFIIKGKIEYKKIIIVFLIIFILLIFMYLFIKGLAGREGKSVLDLIVKRIFLSQTKGMQTAFRVFPKQHGFLNGTSFPNPGRIFQYKPFELSKYIYLKTFGKGLIVGTAPTTYFTEFYVNFGYFAMIGSMFFGACLLQISQIYLIRMKKSILSLGLYGYLIVYLTRISTTSLFYSFGFIFYILILTIFLITLAINSFMKISVRD